MSLLRRTTSNESYWVSLLQHFMNPEHIPKPMPSPNVKKTSESRLITSLSFGFFCASLLLLVFVLYDGLQTRVQENSATTRERSNESSTAMHAKATEVMEFARTPMMQITGLKLQILGLGQDPVTSKQVVWIRDLSTNRVLAKMAGDYLPGDRDKKVKITEIHAKGLALRIEEKEKGHGKPLEFPFHGYR